MNLSPTVTKVTADNFLQALLPYWTKLVPSANSQMLYDAIFHHAQGSAIRCFSIIPDLAADPLPKTKPVSDPVDIHDLDAMRSERRRKRHLLACRIFAEHAHGSSNPACSLRPILEQHGLDFCQLPLASTDCHAISVVSQHHPNSVRRINFGACDIGDSGLALLSPGLSRVRNLTSLNLEGNSLSDRHIPLIAAVVKSSESSLTHLSTTLNAFSSQGIVDLHGNTHMCSALQELDIGSIRSTADAQASFSCLPNILETCKGLLRLDLYNIDLGTSGLSRLEPLLQSLELQELSLANAGLVQDCAPALSQVLAAQKGTLSWLSLSGNALGDGLLSGIHAALSRCERLAVVWLFDADLSPSSLPLLATLLPQWPHLCQLALQRNDFLAAGVEADEFRLAVQSSSLGDLLMPEETAVHSRLRSVLHDHHRDGLHVTHQSDSFYRVAEAANDGDDGLEESENSDHEDGGTSFGFRPDKMQADDIKESVATQRYDPVQPFWGDEATETLKSMDQGLPGSTEHQQSASSDVSSTLRISNSVGTERLPSVLQGTPAELSTGSSHYTVHRQASIGDGDDIAACQMTSDDCRDIGRQRVPPGNISDIVHQQAPSDNGDDSVHQQEPSNNGDDIVQQQEPSNNGDDTGQ
eukprot:scpid26440/ scgid2892/ 